MSAPLDVIIIWPSTNASIPSGWTRDTSFDDKYAKGTADATDPGTTGGATTHSHTSPAHGHTLTNHTHTYQLSGSDAGGGNTGTTADASFNGLHHHTGTTGNASGGALSSVTSTYASVSNNPPYVEVIFIKSLGTHAIPNNGVVFFDNASTPTSWQFCDGSASSPDYRNKYLKGAPAGGDAGATGGSLTNVHTLTHTHTVAAHGHGNSTSSGPLNSTNRDSKNGSSDLVVNNHTHTVSFNDNTDTISATAPILTTAETVEPAYTKLVPIQNQTGGYSKPTNIICMWTRPLAEIPYGWILCDGSNGTIDMRGRHLKMANTTSEAGNTGGANTHTHAAQTHTHTSTGAHGHTGSVSAHQTSSFEPEGSGHAYFTTTAPNHTIASISSETCSYSSDNTTADSSNNEPPYQTVAFIKCLNPQILGGMF